MRGRGLVLFGYVIGSALTGCISESRKEEVIGIVREQFPGFERKAREHVAHVYGEVYLDSTRWTWNVEEAMANDMYNVSYACMDDHGWGKELVGEMIGDLSSELSGGLISVTPWSGNTGIMYEMKVNVRERTVRARKR